MIVCRVQQQKKTWTNTFTSSRSKSDRLWSFQKEGLKQPLLKKLVGKVELVDEACECFVSILKYMGDHPSTRKRIGNELTDQIFEAPLKNVTHHPHLLFDYLLRTKHATKWYKKVQL